MRSAHDDLIIELSDDNVPQFSVRFSVTMATSVHSVIHTTKVFRQHKQQRDHGVELGELDVGLVSFCLVTIRRRKQTELVAICRL
jgi:hypothetical protein